MIVYIIKTNIMSTHKVSPWQWIPTLYMVEGLPYFAVNTLTVLMYVNMGIGMKEMAFYTGWLYLPWVIKPFWSPFVDLIKTKRWWVLIMQFAIAICMGAVAIMLPSSFFFVLTLLVFWIMAFCSATHDIAADGYYMLELSAHDQAAYVGVRSTFYRIASVIGQGGLVIIAGKLEESIGDIPTAWAIVFGLLSLFFLSVTIYHSKFMPIPYRDKLSNKKSVGSIIIEFGHTFKTFFRKKYIWSAIGFMLLYRLPEALCIKLIQPFMASSHSQGGLELSTAQIGIINGTVGVIALLLGGILGGVVISKGGLKKWLWPMAFSLTLPCGFYCLLAMTQPTNFILISTAVFIEQFGYGFGFSAYMLFLIYFSRGESQTSHYAFCTAFMALGMMIPGMIAGWIYEYLSDIVIFESSQLQGQGFVNFFWIVMLTCLATLWICSKVKIESSFGKKI